MTLLSESASDYFAGTTFSSGLILLNLIPTTGGDEGELSFLLNVNAASSFTD